jgi:hypothetical protein
MGEAAYGRPKPWHYIHGKQARQQPAGSLNTIFSASFFRFTIKNKNAPPGEIIFTKWAGNF